MPIGHSNLRAAVKTEVRCTVTNNTSVQTRILVVDDQAVMRRGFCSMLRLADHPFAVEEAADGIQALQQFEQLRPDLVLLDVGLPGVSGIEVARRIHSLEPLAKILMVSELEEDFLQAFRVDARGCLLKSVEAQELLNAVGLVLSGYLVFGKAIVRLIFEHAYLPEEPRKPGKLAISLTKREQEILGLIAQEYTNSEIAKHLYISPRTVDSHRARLMQKLGTRNTAGLVRIAVQQGLLQEPTAELRAYYGT